MAPLWHHDKPFWCHRLVPADGEGFRPCRTNDPTPHDRVMRERKVRSSGAVLVVRDNEASGEPLLLLHGGPGTPDGLQTSVAPLLPGMHCISFDQRGVGSSSCENGRYDLAAYLEDIEAVRQAFRISAWHVLGHSFGGLLGQAYVARHPERVRSLVLSSPSLGVGANWRTTKRTSFRIERHRAGLRGAFRFSLYGSSLVFRGAIRERGMRHLMTEVWHNYFLDPKMAPDPDPAWLAGCSAQAMIATDRAMSHEDPAVLAGVSSYRGPVMVLYGEYDIFDPQSQAIVRRRFPQAVQITLEGSGHLPWLQNGAGYRERLARFFGRGCDGAASTPKATESRGAPAGPA
jgi:proline iminopeptidase